MNRESIVCALYLRDPLSSMKMVFASRRGCFFVGELDLLLCVKQVRDAAIGTEFLVHLDSVLLQFEAYLKICE